MKKLLIIFALYGSAHAANDITTNEIATPHDSAAMIEIKKRNFKFEELKQTIEDRAKLFGEIREFPESYRANWKDAYIAHALHEILDGSKKLAEILFIEKNAIMKTSKADPAIPTCIILASAWRYHTSMREYFDMACFHGPELQKSIKNDWTELEDRMLSHRFDITLVD